MFVEFNSKMLSSLLSHSQGQTENIYLVQATGLLEYMSQARVINRPKKIK